MSAGIDHALARDSRTGGRLDNYDELIERAPDVYEAPIAETEFGRSFELSDDECVLLVESVDDQRRASD